MNVYLAYCCISSMSLLLLHVQAACLSSTSGVALNGSLIKSYENSSFHECFTTCKNNSKCRSINYYRLTSLCHHNSLKISDSPENEIQDSDAVYMESPANAIGETPTAESKEIQDIWVLIARFSNSDAKNWMATSGAWWYDINTSQGDTTSTTVNQDMIAPPFWTTKGNEIKITRTDDPNHTPLLITTSNCLGNMTFREKISSYGNFRNGAVWSSDRCLGKCDVVYAGNYASTVGFAQTSCDSDVLRRNQIGFWCDYSSGDAAVITIGGAGSSCNRADHGIAITEENAGKFGGTSLACDFENDATGSSCSTQSYALNMWIK